MRRQLLALASVAYILGTGLTAEAGIETVAVDDAGNAPDTRYEKRGYGGVNYVYYIGKYEVTNAQYAEFLRAIAADDPNFLYHNSMGVLYGGIVRAGRTGSFTYTLVKGRENMPVIFVGWANAMRFANWMHNGQPVGEQDPSTTEDGAYDLSLDPEEVVRKRGATVFLPTEDEWYKAAYYAGGGTDAGYWDYATQSDTAPSLERPPGSDFVDGSANHRYAVGNLTDVGAYTAKPSDSAYGTYDQGGNLWEWNEALVGTSRGLRGGSFASIGDDDLHAATRYDNISTGYDHTIGFRIAALPMCGGGFDGDEDGDVDLYDFALFQNAFTGPVAASLATGRITDGGIGAGIAEALGSGCGFDRNRDGDVDLHDFAPFEVFLTGP